MNFNGLISTQFKQLHKNAIIEVLRGCGVPCQVVFGTTKFEDCPNCKFDNIGNRSSGIYEPGGPTPFQFGICPVCNGLGRIPNDTSEAITLCPVYDYKQWIPMINSSVRSPNGYVQTISVFSTYSTLKRSKEIIINTDITTTVKSRFEREGDPEPCGIGTADFVITLWKRIEG